MSVADSDTILTTARLIVRKWRSNECSGIQRIWGDPEVMRYLLSTTPVDEQTAGLLLSRFLKREAVKKVTQALKSANIWVIQSLKVIASPINNERIFLKRNLSSVEQPEMVGGWHGKVTTPVGVAKISVRSQQSLNTLCPEGLGSSVPAVCARRS